MRCRAMQVRSGGVHKWGLLLIDRGCLWYVLVLVWRQMRVFDRQVVEAVVHIGQAVVSTVQTGNE